MNAVYAPGTVADATVRGVPNVRVMRVDSNFSSAEWASSEGPGPRLHEGRGVTDVHPLVVIDPENRAQVERLVVAHCRAYCCDPAPLQPEEVAIMQDALREFANPKPAEPRGRYAAVIDANGNEWVRLGEGPAPWMHNGSPDNRDTLPWSKLDAVRVLSEGVTQ